ncbi:MAG: hypothetical protein IKW91_08030 [Bacteroidaceae bacterium]|nr:hypothetical protein [Bacteroidaceae bacterium]
MIFQVEIFESNSKVEEIEAETREEALSKVRKADESGELNLTDDNSFVDVSFNIA